VNAEFGDTDTGADGDDTPFVKAGLAPAGAELPMSLQESTDPAIQDAALLNAFNSRSLSEITDGEGGGFSSFKVLFEQSLAFDSVGGDGLPDIVFFERGLNDVFDVQLITGGSFATPVLSDPLTIDSGQFASAGFQIDTVEIGSAQSMGVGGFDLVDFGLGPGSSAFGFVLSTTAGPDLGGFFLAAADPDDFGDPLDAGDPGVVPLPASAWMLIGALGLAGYARWRARGV